MTAKEVVESSKRIAKRRKSEAEFEAAIHGAKLKSESDDLRVNGKLNEKESAFASMRIEQAMKEKQQAYAEAQERAKKKANKKKEISHG